MTTSRLLAALLTLLLLAGCAGSGAGDDAGGTEMARSGADGDGAVEQAAAEEAGDADSREVITTGSLTLVASQIGEAVDELVAIVERAGGRIDERSEYTDHEGRDSGAWLTVRVPAAELTATISRIEELGEVPEVSVSSDDVTLRARDLDARITALQTSSDRLIELMATAETSEALIDAEDALSRRQEELESLRTERAYLSDQVAMSTLHISVSTETTVELEAGGFLGGLENGWNALIGFASGLLVVLGTVLPWLAAVGLPLAVAAVLVRRRRRDRAEVAQPEPTPA